MALACLHYQQFFRSGNGDPAPTGSRSLLRFACILEGEPRSTAPICSLASPWSAAVSDTGPMPLEPAAKLRDRYRRLSFSVHPSCYLIKHAPQPLQYSIFLSVRMRSRGCRRTSTFGRIPRQAGTQVSRLLPAGLESGKPWRAGGTLSRRSAIPTGGVPARRRAGAAATGGRISSMRAVIRRGRHDILVGQGGERKSTREERIE